MGFIGTSVASQFMHLSGDPIAQCRVRPLGVVEPHGLGHGLPALPTAAT